ncbi:MAG: TIGR01777 family oxidoreductase [Thermodesulfobacteriota bacterium]
MEVFVTGGAGFVGSALVDHLVELGHTVVVLTRSARARPPAYFKRVEGDPIRPGPWQDYAARADAAVNLAGASIVRRWTAKARKEIRDSRVLTTRNLVQAVSREPRPGRVLLSASAVGYYGFRGDEEIDETGLPGDDFLAGVARAWEAEALKAREAGARVGLMRFGVVLGPGGGALSRMIPLFRLGLGGRLGHGRQWFSWIHLADLVRAAAFLLEAQDASGPFNFTAPTPVTNAELTRALARVLKRPAFLPVPAFLMRLALGEFASTLLKGQRVVPSRLEKSKFGFLYRSIESAVQNAV